MAIWKGPDTGAPYNGHLPRRRREQGRATRQEKLAQFRDGEKPLVRKRKAPIDTVPAESAVCQSWNCAECGLTGISLTQNCKCVRSAE